MLKKGKGKFRFVGMIMKTTQLKNIGKFQSGGTPSKKVESYFGGNIPWITTVALNGKIIDQSNATDWLTEKGVNKSATKIVPPYSLMIGTRVGVGKVAVNKVSMCTNQDIISIVDINTEDWDIDYLRYFIKASAPYLNKQARGATIQGIKLEVLQNLKLPLISVEEQKRVALILQKVNLVIDNRKTQLNALDDLIKSRFVELFGDPVKNTMNWQVCKLGDLSVQINSGNTPKGGEQVYVDKGITFFRSQNVWKGRLEMEDIAYIDKETHGNMKRSSLKHGDILMTKTGRINTENSSLGRAALYLGEDDTANVNGHVYFIRLKPEINNEFVLKILVSKEYLGYIRSVCVGGIDKRQLNKNHIEDFPIICPPKDMQNKFIEFVQQVEKLKVKVKNSLDETQVLFDSLMLKYFD
ncbi:restriction endonuclease subunit S [Kineothrix sedimenti]|uniref:Restriction endonuclease subunit S n=1 Tax=Kineothrix sedimenti TaxID=3123317 RepID=A0ABZ3EZ69_9FIRM